MPSYYVTLTTVGLARLATAQATGVPLLLTGFSVGDGNGSAITPSASMTELVNEVYRGDVNSVDIHSTAPSTVRVEGIIPVDYGGWVVREFGLWSSANELIAIGSVPATAKPVPADGASADMIIRALIEYSDVTALSLSVDPAVVLASREYVDNATGNQLWLHEVFA